MTHLHEAGAIPGAVQRPTRHLPWAHLFNLSVYWLGINVIWAGLGNVTYQARFREMFGDAYAPTYTALMFSLPIVIAILVQPTVAMISDYTITRWGRRKPYILIGTLLDVVFLFGVATANEFLVIFSFVILLQISSNFAQGPFQGYVPDLVPASQVGIASGLMGVMIVLGNVLGVGIATLGLHQLDALIQAAGPGYAQGTPEAVEIARQAFLLPTIGLGLIELVTMIPIMLFIDEGRGAPDRGGRSWLRIALAAWGTDLLRQRSYVWLLVSRLFFLMVPSLVTGIGLFYLVQALGQSNRDAADSLTVIAATMGGITGLTTFPAARLSDRIGRKRTIYGAIGLAIVGMTGIVLAPDFGVTVVFLVPLGIALGAFLAVDWALMTDIIPKATTARYMSISNAATGIAGPLGLLLGGTLVTALVLFGLPPELRGLPVPPAEQSELYGLAPRAALALTLPALLISALTLTRVDETRRED
ncbi:MAG TPA: MFS transporter [Candidatus Limnocylindrales bacterium]|nr:MFS transporter [Candidatus Limnocylindrales bacterium]